MKKTFTLMALGLMLMNAGMQAQSWQWAQRAGNSSNDSGNGITVDAAGNTYVTGSYSGPTITFGSTTFTNSGGLDMFTVKYDPSGNVVWASSGKGSSNEVGYNVAVDGSGNTYVVGTFNSASLVMGSFTLALSGFDDIFIAKYDPSGNVLWAKKAGGSSNDIGQNISIDASGNAYITGYFTSTSMAVGSTTLTNAGGEDLYTIKYDASGNVLWAKAVGGSGNDSANGIVADGSGNCYVTGSYASSSITFGSTTLTNTGSLDLFTVKYDASGNVLWAKTATGASNEVGYNVKLDASGNLYLVGNYNSSNFVISSTSLSCSGYDDLFIAKYDASGNLLWAKKAGGANNDVVESIAVDNNGNSCITGYFQSSSLAFGSTSLTNSGTSTIFVAGYDASGNVLWAKSAGGTADDHGNAIAVDASGNNAYITGYFTSSTISFSATVLTNAGGNDVFAAKLGIATTGISEAQVQLMSLSVVPNPNSGAFEVWMKNVQVEQEISVTNAMGQLVFETRSSLNKIPVKLENPGIYFITVKAGAQRSTQKLVVN